MHASLQLVRRSRFTIHELQAPTGTKVREFVGSSGKVFSVAWAGRWRPNLRELMGSHYDSFLAGMRGRRVARGPVRLDLPGMVVIMGGRLRAFWGQVYLTDLLPAGLKLADVR